jgi:hypothetical protein
MTRDFNIKHVFSRYQLNLLFMRMRIFPEIYKMRMRIFLKTGKMRMCINRGAKRPIPGKMRMRIFWTPRKCACG